MSLGCTLYTGSTAQYNVASDIFSAKIVLQGEVLHQYQYSVIFLKMYTEEMILLMKNPEELTKTFI